MAEEKKRLRGTSDSLTSLMSGLGTDRDKRTHNHFVWSPQDYYGFAELEAAYATNWIARAIIDIPVEDSTREWRSFSAEDASDIQRAEKRYKVQQAVQEAFKWAGLYGGSGIVMITDQDLSLPIDVNKIKKDSLKRLLVLDRRYLSGMDIQATNPTAANFMMPDVYMINGGSARVHHSHIIRVPGARLPMMMRQANGGWDDSQLRKCMEDLKDAVSAKGGIAALIQEANVDIISKEGLYDAMASDDASGLATRRYQMFGMMKSMIHMGLLDSTETYERKGASFGGLGEILGTLMEWTAGAAQIPMTRLFGVQSKGMGDSGAGDERNYNNSIRSKQESDYRDVLEQIDAVMIRSALGYMPEDLEFEWNPLSQPSDTELAQQELAFSQADGIRMDQGTVKPSQVMRRLQARGTYAITDEQIDSMEADEKAEAMGEFDVDGESVLGSDNIEASEALNGAQVTALMEVIQRVRSGELTKPTATRVITASFPLDESQAVSLLEEVEYADPRAKSGEDESGAVAEAPEEGEADQAAD